MRAGKQKCIDLTTDQAPNVSFQGCGVDWQIPVVNSHRNNFCPARFQPSDQVAQRCPRYEQWQTPSVNANVRDGTTRYRSLRSLHFAPAWPASDGDGPEAPPRCDGCEFHLWQVGNAHNMFLPGPVQPTPRCAAMRRRFSGLTMRSSQGRRRSAQSAKCQSTKASVPSRSKIMPSIFLPAMTPGMRTSLCGGASSSKGSWSVSLR